MAEVSYNLSFFKSPLQWFECAREKANPIKTSNDKSYAYMGFSHSRLEKNIQALAVISGLGNNWNTYGAKPFDRRIIVNAERVLNRINKQPIIVAPTGRETIQFDFEKKEKYLELEIGRDLITFYSEGITSNYPEEFAMSINDKSVDVANELIECVYR